MSQPEDRSVLIVDDEEYITDLVSRSLSRHGLVCDTASNGVEALRRLRERPTALVLTDMRMPFMNGLDLLEQVRAHYPDTFVVLLTGAADVSTVLRAFRTGACDFLTKPFTPDEVVQHVIRALQKREEHVVQRRRRESRDAQLAHLAERYRRLSSGVLASLTAVLGTKHPETSAHSQRVALQAARLAEGAGLSESDVECLYIAGLLHDIGKVAVDGSLLEKTGRLDTLEFDQIRSHPVESERIITPISFSPAILEAIRHHHERFDGTGYPDGLAGFDIPLPARILAICDSYDAMTSERTYQPALPPQEGLTRLRAGAGKQWDPAIVDIFCGLEEESNRGLAVS